MNLQEKLVSIQGRLKAPKNQRNNFGKYNYRSCEDILEAVKPLLVEHNMTLTISDIVVNDGLHYVDATATVSDGESSLSVSAQAGIDPNRKGMDIAQSFGSSSSYARKYALNGLFLIDDTKDADATNTHGNSSNNASTEELDWLNETDPKFKAVKNAIKEGKATVGDVRKKFKVSKKVEQLLIN
jgi:hypothetical protein